MTRSTRHGADRFLNADVRPAALRAGPGVVTEIVE